MQTFLLKQTMHTKINQRGAYQIVILTDETVFSLIIQRIQVRQQGTHLKASEAGADVVLFLIFPLHGIAICLDSEFFRVETGVQLLQFSSSRHLVCLRIFQVRIHLKRPLLKHDGNP